MRKKQRNILGAIFLILFVGFILIKTNVLPFSIYPTSIEPPLDAYLGYPEEHLTEYLGNTIDEDEIESLSMLVLPPGEYLANDDCSFITNSRGDGFNDYGLLKYSEKIGFISVDSDKNGIFEGYYSAGTPSYNEVKGVPNFGREYTERCDLKEAVAYTPEGLKVIKGYVSPNPSQGGEEVLFLCSPQRYKIEKKNGVETKIPIDNELIYFKPFAQDEEDSHVIISCSKCDSGEEHCDGNMNLRCIDGSWRNLGFIVGKCGFTIDNALIDKINSLQVTIGEKADVIKDLTDQSDEQSKIINGLTATINEKAQIIGELTKISEEQAQIITDLDLTIKEKAELINQLTSKIDKQAEIISQLELTTQEQAQYIIELTINVEEQAEMINSLTTNLQQKAELVDKLEVENEKQAELIKEMKLSFSEQGIIIEALNKAVEDDAEIISSLTTKLDEQGEIIAGMKLTNKEQAKLIEELTSEVSQQAEIIDGLKLKLDEEKSLVSQFKTTIAEQEKLIENLKNIKDSRNNLYLVVGILALVVIFLLFYSGKKK